MTEKEAKELITEKSRDILRGLLKQCKPDQVDLFNKMYKSVDSIELEKIPWAIVQCERTIQLTKTT